MLGLVIGPLVALSAVAVNEATAGARFLRQHFPDDAYCAEEDTPSLGRSKTAARTWVVDPIDGTRSFILGQLHWASLIAVNDGERVVAGIAHQPYVGESFLARVCANEFCSFRSTHDSRRG